MLDRNKSYEDDIDGIFDINQLIHNDTEYYIDDLNEVPVDNFVFIVDGVVLTSVSVFGVIGTFMSIFVLIKPRVRGNSRDLFSKFLTALAVYDSMFLFLAILLFGLPTLSFW